MKLSTAFTFDKVQFDQDNKTHMVFSLTAPKLDWEAKRPPLVIVPVIDISGSMDGDKLDYAKKSVIKMLDHLKPGDYAGLVTFGSVVNVLAPPTELTQTKREELKAKVGALRATDMTNFSDAMLAALDAVNKMDLPEGVVLRVIMFTDGHANVGVARDHNSIVALLDTRLGKASVSAFGYGDGANQEMLTDLAKKGRGNYAFIKNPDDALSAFAKELGGLLSIYAQDITLTVRPTKDHTIQGVVSDVDADGDKNSVTIKVGDLMSEETRNLVVELNLGKQTKALPREVNIVDVEVKYNTTAADGTKTQHEETLRGKVKFVKAGDEQKEPHKDADAIVGLAELVKAQIEAEQQAAVGNYIGAQKTMGIVNASFARRKLSGHVTTASKVSASLGDSLSYASSSGYRNSMKSGVTRSYGTSMMDSEAAQDLGGLGISAVNSLMESMVEQFKEAKKDPDAPILVPVVNTHPFAIPSGGSVSVVINPPPVVQPPAPPAPVEPPPTITKKRSNRW
jgi:Ca-activated chloride channel family protein